MNEILQDKDEILRYLGHKGQGIDEVTNSLVEESIEDMRNLIYERYNFKIFNISRDKEHLWLENSNFRLPGNDIRKHLNKSDRCILLGVTLGHEVDTKIRYYEKTSMTKALILDACATAAIEEICDKICEKIEKDLIRDTKALTSRYSPGYGDLPLDIQSDFLSLMSGGKAIGLTSTNSGILIPRKSVTAIMGIIDFKDKEKSRSCRSCNNYSTCSYSKGGGKCES